MDSNFVIALTGITLSALTSFYISTRQSKIEIRKLRDEYSHRYAGKVFEKRLESYPKLVEPLVIFIQKVNLFKIKKINDMKPKLTMSRICFKSYWIGTLKTQFCIAWNFKT